MYGDFIVKTILFFRCWSGNILGVGTLRRPLEDTDHVGCWCCRPAVLTHRSRIDDSSISWVGKKFNSIQNGFTSDVLSFYYFEVAPSILLNEMLCLLRAAISRACCVCVFFSARYKVISVTRKAK